MPAPFADNYRRQPTGPWFVVLNDVDPLSSSTTLTELSKRFIRRGALSDGYGLGCLDCFQDLCCPIWMSPLEIYVPPRKNSPRGFAADFELPKGKNQPA